MNGWSIDMRKHDNSELQDRTARLAEQISTRMDRGAPVHRDEVERLKLLARVIIETKKGGD